MAPIPASPAYAATATFSGEIVEDGDTLFRRVDRVNCTDSTAAPNYQYNVYPFTVDADGIYTIEMTAAFFLPAGDDDTHITLYETAFDPAAPLTNCVESDDDDGAGALSRITRNLTAGTQYILVITTYDALSVGTYSGWNRATYGWRQRRLQADATPGQGFFVKA